MVTLAIYTAGKKERRFARNYVQVFETAVMNAETFALNVEEKTEMLISTI